VNTLRIGDGDGDDDDDDDDNNRRSGQLGIMLAIADPVQYQFCSEHIVTETLGSQHFIK
jgi:hypothetical protein